MSSKKKAQRASKKPVAPKSVPVEAQFSDADEDVEADRCVFDDERIRRDLASYEQFIANALALIPAKPTQEEGSVVSATIRKIEEVEKEVVILKSRIDFNSFVEYVLRDDETGKPVKQSPIHRTWAELCKEHKRLIIWAHRNAGKTTQISVARTVWELGRDPSLRFLILSNTAEIAQRIIKSIAGLIEDNPRVKQIFPHLEPHPKGPWTNTQLTVVRDSNSPSPSVRAAGIHGSVTGMRVDRAIVDDILDFENTNTEAERKKTMGWYKATVPGCLTRRARVTIVGTAYHPADFIHEMSMVRGYIWKRFPLITEDNKITWPGTWTWERVEEQRSELGPAEFARQYYCKARDDNESRFRQDWIDAALKRGTGVPLITSLAELSEEEQAVVKVFTGVDLSTGKKKKKSDRTSFFTLLQYPNGDRRIALIDSGKFTGPEIIDKVKANHERFGAIIAVEDNGCFPPETRVLTSEGYKAIESVEVGNKVLTHKGNWKTVIDVTRSLFSGDLVGLRAAGGLPVWSTPNHAFLVKNSGRVLGARDAPDVGKHRPVGESGWLSSSLIKSAQDQTWAHYLASPTAVWPVTAPVLNVNRYNSSRQIEVTEELALWLGLYLAEGSAANKTPQVTFAFHDDEHYFRKFVQRVAHEVFEASTYETRGEGQCVRITVNSVEAHQICRQLKKSVNKALPFEWMGWPLKLRLAIVRGWFLGDGALINNNVNIKPARHFSGTSISRNLVLQMRATLNEAGFKSTLTPVKVRTSSIRGRTIRSKQSFKLNLCRDTTRQFLELCIAEIEKTRWKRPSEDSIIGRESGPQSVSDENGCLWTKLKKKSLRSYTGIVHNLVVEEDNSYVVEDLAAHNSQAYILQFANETMNVPVVPHTTTKAKRDPVLGVESLAIELANGKWIFPRAKDGSIHPELHEFIQEMLFFDPKAHTGDRLMSCYFAREVARRYAGDARYVPQMTMSVLGETEAQKSEETEVYRSGTSLRSLFDVPDAP